MTIKLHELPAVIDSAVRSMTDYIRDTHANSIPSAIGEDGQILVNMHEYVEDFLREKPELALIVLQNMQQVWLEVIHSVTPTSGGIRKKHEGE